MTKYYKKATLDEVFDKITTDLETQVALVFEDKEITYGELRRLSYSIAIRLQNLGVKKGDKVAMLLPNCYEFLCLYFGIFLIGAWAVPINSRVKEKELEGIVVDSEVETIFFQDVIANRNYEDILNRIKEETKLKNFILRSDNKNKETPNMLSFDDFLKVDDNINEQIKSFEPPEVEESDVALLAYTSGTTSSPKGVMITHSGLVETSYSTGKLWFNSEKIQEAKLAFSVAPLYAAQGFLAVLFDFVSGIPIRWLSNFNPNDIIKTIADHRTKFFHTQPTMWSIILSSPLLKLISFKHLEKTVVSGSVCSYNLAKRIHDATGSTLLNAYGLIEATGIVTVTRPDDPLDVRLNTVGRPIPGVELKIVDENRKIVPKGEVGELVVKGYLMKGYHRNEEKTKEVIDEEGWLYTGDLAAFYKDTENIQIVGRSKDMIIRGGFNVYPIDIEEELLSHVKVQDVSVVGKKDDILSECIVAFVIPEPGQKIKKWDILRYCRECLPDYRIPDEVYFVKQFPTLLSGKVRKNVLREWAENGIPDEELHEN
jgi:fatty-acyl-CoA synthase